MQRYAVLSLVSGLMSATFIDPEIKKSVSTAGRYCTILCAVVFVITEGMALAGM